MVYSGGTPISSQPCNVLLRIAGNDGAALTKANRLVDGHFALNDVYVVAGNNTGMTHGHLPSNATLAMYCPSGSTTGIANATDVVDGAARRLFVWLVPATGALRLDHARDD